ncbi:hypothetical protein RB595_009409 [Gaeumannomyces hyphopodioides]
MSLKSIFGGARAAGAAATPAPEEPTEPAPAPPKPTPDKRVEAKARWRLGISCSDEEFQSKADEFAAMFGGRHPRPLDEVLDEHFTEHEKALFTRAPRDSELGRLQRDYSRKYHRLLRTAQFRNAKVATPAEARVTKLTMLYFGLPVSPCDSMGVDHEPPSDSEDEWAPKISDDEGSGALRWLNAYTKRTYGMGVDRNALDPKYEEFYQPRGTKRAIRTKNDGWYSHFKQDMASLRGGAGSMHLLASDSDDNLAQPTGPFWRFHGRRGQVVFHDLDSFRLAVDRLLGLRQRGGSEVLLVVRDDTTLRHMVDTKKFTTDTEGEDGIFRDYIKRLDPAANRRTYYLTLSQLVYPKTPLWMPDKNDKRVMMVRREGDASGEVAYLNMMPFTNPYFALNPELGSSQFTSYLCDVAKFLIPGTTSAGQSLVHRTVQVRSGNITANSLGGLNLTSDLLRVLYQHATGVAYAELTISCPEPQKDGSLKWRIYIPGVCLPYQNIANFSLNPRRAKGSLADTLRKLLRSVMGTEYNKISHVEIFCPGERMLRTRGRGEPGPYDFDIRQQDAGVDETLEEVVAFTGFMQKENPQNRAFMGVRPVFEEYKAIMRSSAGNFNERGRPSFKFSTPCKRWSGCTLAEFRELVLANSQCPEDADPGHSDIYISQVQPGGAKEPDSENCVAGSRNPILIRHDMNEGNWAVITRLISSKTLYVQRVASPTALDLEKQKDVPFGFSHKMWNSGRPSDGLFPQLQPLGPGLRGAARGNKPQGATSKVADGNQVSRAAGAEEGDTFEDQPEPAHLRRPPPYSTKYPLSQAERDAAARQASFAGPISIYEQDGPRIPQFGPPVEQFLYTGPSVPSVSRSMMTATEQRKLSNAFVKMRNIVVGRTYACPFKGCEETFQAGDTDAIHAHADEVHSVEKCNFCDERLYRHWDAEQRRRHFAVAHADLFVQPSDEDRDRVAGLGVVADKGLCAGRERAYNFCPRCGRDHHALGRHADRVQHDNACNPSINYPEDRPFCFCDDCHPGDQAASMPHPARDCCGGAACRTYVFCEECGDANADGGCPHPEAKCAAKDIRNVGRAPYCIKCGLALAPYTERYREKHVLCCRGFNGTPDAFCPWCGVAASNSREDWLAHLGGCEKNTGGDEGPLDPASGSPWDAPLPPADSDGNVPRKCRICGANIDPHTGQGHWDHFATEHAGDGGSESLGHCPYCDGNLSFASLGWGDDERGTASKIAHLQQHIDWTKDVFDDLDIQGEGRGPYLKGMDTHIDEQYGASGQADASDQPETRAEDTPPPVRGRGKGKKAAAKNVDIPPPIKTTPAPGEGISPTDVTTRSPAKSARGGRGGARGGRAVAAAARAVAPPGKGRPRTKGKPAVTVINYGSEDEELFWSSSEDDGPHPNFPGGGGGDGDYEMSERDDAAAQHEPAEKAAARRHGHGHGHGPADLSYKPRKPSDWDDPALIKEAVFDPPVEGSPGLPAVAAGASAKPGDMAPPAKPAAKRKRAAGAAGSPAATKKRKVAEAPVKAPAAKKAPATPAAKKVAATPATKKAPAAAKPATKKAPAAKPATVGKAAGRKLATGTALKPPALASPATRRMTRAASRALSEAASSDAP